MVVLRMDAESKRCQEPTTNVSITVDSKYGDIRRTRASVFQPARDSSRGGRRDKA